MAAVIKNSFLKAALELAKEGFFVFPLVPGSKLPLVDEFYARATRNPEMIRKFWVDPVFNLAQPYNVGISTTTYGDGQEALLVVDIDTKKNGEDTLLLLELEGKEFPPTREHLTPTGGKHLFYRVSEQLSQGVDELGMGVDTRAYHGYVAAPGSEVPAGVYSVDKRQEIAPAPEWLVDFIKAKPNKKSDTVAAPIEHINQDVAVERAKEYLTKLAPESIKGQGGDQTAYKVAAQVKDFGVDQATCLELMLEHWFDGSGWAPEKLKAKVDHAYKYGQSPVGAIAPESDFEEIKFEEPKTGFLQEINKEYAIIFEDGSHTILHETVDERGKLKRKFMKEYSFKRRFSPFIVQQSKRGQPVTYADLWLDWQGRREYEGVCFAPEREPKNKYYNLWRGFSCEPVAYNQASAEARLGYDMFKEHLEMNVCEGNKKLAEWLFGYFAHMIQKPYERPLVTLVFKGLKGTGKNALIERVGNLLGAGHFLVSHDSRYLTSNFNGHLDSCLCLVLDEAFWSGDKAAEGKLKGLTTSPTILIERKGKEPFTVDNLVRIVVIGNEGWLVPATADERRWAVFEVGEGRRKDQTFFEKMRILIDQKGGNSVLLHELKSFDLAQVSVNTAPETQGLHAQKIASLEPFFQWWHECLIDGHIEGIDFAEGWTLQVNKDSLRTAFLKYWRERQIRARMPTSEWIGRQLRTCCPSAHPHRKKDHGKSLHTYHLPELSVARAEWDKWIGHPSVWDEPDPLVPATLTDFIKTDDRISH